MDDPSDGEETFGGGGDEASWFEEASQYTQPEAPVPRHTAGFVPRPVTPTRRRAYALEDTPPPDAASHAKQHSIKTAQRVSCTYEIPTPRPADQYRSAYLDGDDVDVLFDESDGAKPHRSAAPSPLALHDETLHAEANADDDLSRVMDLLHEYDAVPNVVPSVPSAELPDTPAIVARSGVVGGRPTDDPRAQPHQALDPAPSASAAAPSKQPSVSVAPQDSSATSIFGSIRSVYATIEALRTVPKTRFDPISGRLLPGVIPDALRSVSGSSLDERSSTYRGTSDKSTSEGAATAADGPLPPLCLFRASVVRHERRVLRAYCRRFVTPRCPADVASLPAAHTLPAAQAPPRPSQVPQPIRGEPRVHRDTDRTWPAAPAAGIVTPSHGSHSRQPSAFAPPGIVTANSRPPRDRSIL
jgi:hypothetical protein